MADPHKFPASEEEVDAADLVTLLGWNQHLPAPTEGTHDYAMLARIVARLRATRDEHVAKHGDSEPLPHPDHPGWPLP